MGGWVDGWMIVWVDGWMYRWVGEWVGGRVLVRGCVHVCARAHVAVAVAHGGAWV